ncbi:hypothetical protein HWV62_11225 [Athelia sp. TMB]|nr:hypothetical protein HWV62_11225 [Athelia sp. TMB]
MRDLEREEEAIQVGAKRKRVVSSNENVVTQSKRGSRQKRLKATRQQQEESEEEPSEMEVDTPSISVKSDESEEEQDDEDDDSSEHYLINTAGPRQLLRLRKDQLIEVYTSAGLTPPSSFESLTKPEIVEAIVAAREATDDDPDDSDGPDESIDLPPSSPRGGSEYSSDGEVGDEQDDGNVAGGEETDAVGSWKRPRGGNNLLRRRATVNDFGSGSGRPLKGRSLSMGQMGPSSISSKAKLGRGVSGARRQTSVNGSSRSSPNGSMSSQQSYLPSPPATRTRARKVSADTMPSIKTVQTKAKGKAKQVEFSDNVQVQLASPLTSASEEEEDPAHSKARAEESDLTDLSDLEADIQSTPRAKGANITQPSPRRLRSKGSKTPSTSDSEAVPPIAVEVDRRVTPMRKAKGRIGNLREDSESVDEDASGQEEESDEMVDEEAVQDEEEVDELASSPSPSPSVRSSRSPVKKHLRPRRVQTHTPPSDGDDEEEHDIAEEIEEEVEGSEAGADDEAEDLSVTPRKLRSGRIVGEEDVGGEDEDEEDVGEEEDANEEEEEVEEEVDDAESIDIDAEGETEEDSDEPMEDDIDLTIATAKTLVRLRRDDLVRLCETRDLEVVGTKPQLASALLEWRDRQSQSGFSSPSSTGTARPPSTKKPRRKTSSGKSRGTPPVLLRSQHYHADEPRTPPISGLCELGPNGHKEPEPELELDLESLGLEDREIPPEKLTKLEKIGSGGFKDVFIGKFKGRKIAISEFRGQLSAMDIKELKLLGGFDHPNIVRFLGVSIPENTRETPVMIISELCSNGDLFDYVRNVQAPSMTKVLNIMLDIARGLEYLHLRKPSVIHRDCKSSNILITSRGTAKIADFGLAKVKQSTRSMVRSLVGTVNWQAPELWHAHPKYNHKVDVFSCAMVYWEMLQWHNPNKKFPWEGMNEHAIYEKVGTKRQRPSIAGLRTQWCPEIVELMERMWAHEHQDRPTMSEVVEELENILHKSR